MKLTWNEIVRIYRANTVKEPLARALLMRCVEQHRLIGELNAAKHEYYQALKSVSLKAEETLKRMETAEGEVSDGHR